jgi:hypothetical protein
MNTTQSGYKFAKSLTIEQINEPKPEGTMWLNTPRARACGFNGSAYKVTHDKGRYFVDTLTEARAYARLACKLNTHAPWAEIFRSYESGVCAGFALVATYERELIVG